jgi:arylsulfatase A-like enzyme
MVMFDSLNRHFLPSYGSEWIHAPNFKRLQEKSVVFDRCYAGSLPCMPARRELHTGRYNFLHRCWGPIEPFDDSLPALLKGANIHSHLVSDHYHYWEDGGATYHQRYSTWEIVRGQEGDNWKGYAGKVETPENLYGRWSRQDWINRRYTKEEKDAPQTRCFDLGLEFIEANKNEDNWFLNLEVFDPHEPFVSPDKYAELYNNTKEDFLFDWPEYKKVEEDEAHTKHLRHKYAALLAMCDRNLGRILDIMDRDDMWKDTLLIVNTDHGFLLSEHGWWGKNIQPVYEEISHIPLFIWDPRSGVKNERRASLVQTIDLAPTLLGFFGLGPTQDMQGKNLKETISHDIPVRTKGLFGMFGASLNLICDNYVYMRAPDYSKLSKLNNYTLMPTHMRQLFSVSELQKAELCSGFSFTKGCPLLKIPAAAAAPGGKPVTPQETQLFDIKHDPGQEHPLHDPETEERMRQTLIEILKESDAPPELYGIYNLN